MPNREKLAEFTAWRVQHIARAKKDSLARFLAFNQEATAKINRDEPVMPLGTPKIYPGPRKLMTEDCIKSA